MRSLGYESVMVTHDGADEGLDVVSSGAAAQVKHYAVSIGSDKVREHAGSAEAFPARLFYSLSGYTAKAVAAADERKIALFQYDMDGSVAAINPAARTVTAPPVKPWYEPLDFEDRLARCLRWSGQIRDYVRTSKISNSDRRAQKQLAQRAAALQTVVRAMETLSAIDNPTFKRGRQQRMLKEAESLLRGAAADLGLPLR